MEVHDKIAEIVTMVDSARTMPMSSTAMVNKNQLLTLLDEVREDLPENLRAAEAVLGQREALLIEARGNADRILHEARNEHARLVADHGVTQAARLEAEEILQAAREQAELIRNDADDYVDAKLARLEVAAQRIVETVRDGREQLRHPTPYEELSHGRNGFEPEAAGATAASAQPDSAQTKAVRERSTREKVVPEQSWHDDELGQAVRDESEPPEREVVPEQPERLSRSADRGPATNDEAAGSRPGSGAVPSSKWSLQAAEPEKHDAQA